LLRRTSSGSIRAAAVLALAGTIAGWLPAHRAARIDPLEVLRSK